MIGCELNQPHAGVNVEGWGWSLQRALREPAGKGCSRKDSPPPPPPAPDRMLGKRGCEQQRQVLTLISAQQEFVDGIPRRSGSHPVRRTPGLRKDWDSWGFNHGQCPWQLPASAGPPLPPRCQGRIQHPLVYTLGCQHQAWDLQPTPRAVLKKMTNDIKSKSHKEPNQMRGQKVLERGSHRAQGTTQVRVYRHWGAGGH